MSSVSLPVCLSVTLVDCDHIGWNSSEIISPLVSLGCSSSADPNIRGLLQGEHPEILAQSATPVDLSELRKLRPNGYRWRNGHYGETIGNHHRCFERCYRWPHDLPFPKMGFHVPQKYANGHISATGDSMHFMFGSKVSFQGRRIEWRYFWLHQIQDGGRHLVKFRMAIYVSPQRLIRSTYIARIARSPLDSTSFLSSFKRQYLENGSRYGQSYND